jgi:hypothetical protein
LRGCLNIKRLLPKDCKTHDLAGEQVHFSQPGIREPRFNSAFGVQLLDP